VFIRCKPITADLYDYIEFELVQYRYYSYSQHAGYEKPHHLKLTRVNRRIEEVKNIYMSFVTDLYLNSKEEDAKTISEILLRAASEPEFRNQLIKEPSEVLGQFNISDEARSVIKTSINDFKR